MYIRLLDNYPNVGCTTSTFFFGRKKFLARERSRPLLCRERFNFAFQGLFEALNGFIQVVCCCHGELVVRLYIVVCDNVVDLAVFSFFWFDNEFYHEDISGHPVHNTCCFPAFLLVLDTVFYIILSPGKRDLTALLYSPVFPPLVCHPEIHRGIYQNNT